ncbi:MAG: hypothetical protein BGO51_00040 [Rhodospirillales bacterium 69-11]|nr:AMP-binding protein [Rhodospirillales bacterium]OJW18879.1 MAG: hypothetical protein BGO51_00040 [Rhodospirillales bacterium 69-11]
MTLDAFLQDLARRGVTLAAEGDALSLRAPKGVLTEADRDRLRAEKPAILAALRPLPVEDGAPFPLTDIQQAYLIGRAAELELGRVGCHAYREFEHDGLDLDRLEQAWNRLVARHPMLRAVFGEDGRQRVLPEVPPYRIERLDFRTAPDAEAQLAQLRAERSHRVFDPASWPLFEIHAALLPDRIRLSVGIDLLIADAAALITLFREWGALYADPASDLPPPRGRFADHVRRLPAPSDRDRAYWEGRLDTLPPGPDLPRLPLDGPPRFSRRSIRLAAPSWRALKQAAAAQGITQSALVATVFAEVLAAWSRRARFSLTLTQFGAPPDMQGVVGDFTATVLLEVDTTPATFRARAQALQRRLLADLDHAGLSGVAVMRELRRRRPEVEPVSVVFTSTLGHPGLDPDAPSPLAWLGRSVHAITQTPQVAMDHHVLEEDGALVASWDVVEALFPPGVLDGMVRAYGDLLDALVEGRGWDGRIVDCLPRQARAPLRPGPEPALLQAGFERQAALAPDRPAVIAPDRVLDYGSLDRAATRLAARIAAAFEGETRDRLVAVTEPKGWRQVLAVVGILKAGAAYLPVDPALPEERRRHLIARGEALVPDPAWLDAALDGPVPDMPPVQDPSRLAYVIYTSGSTGEPKGVMIAHAAAVTTVAEVNRRWSIGSADRVLGLSALSFDLSVWDMFGPLATGGALVLPGPEAARDPAAWRGLLTGHRVTVWNSVPALMAMLVEHGLPKGHALRLVMMSGDWVPLPLVRRLAEDAPDARIVALGGATEAAIWSNAHEVTGLDPAWASVPYGLPLAGQMLRVVNERGEDCPDWVTGEIQIAGAGLARGYWRDPARSAERFVTNPMTGERRYRTGDLGRFRPYAPGGVAGEGSRVVAGEAPRVMAGEGRPSTTTVGAAGKVVDGRHKAGHDTGGWGAAGHDTGARSDAAHDAGGPNATRQDIGPTPIEFLGREDFQVKVQGHRIELGEIEAALATHPDVEHAVVTALPQGGDKALHAFVVPRREAWDRVRFLLERPGLRRLPGAPRLALPHRPEAATYDDRRSVRRFRADAVPLDALASVLAVAAAGRSASAAPAPGPLSVRVVARRVEGLAPGLWQHALATSLDTPATLTRRGDAPACDIPDRGTARIAEAAAFLLLLDAPAVTPDALRAAGAAGQRMMRAAQAAGLGLCPIGVLRIEGARVLHAFAGGLPAAETAGFDLAGALREHCAAVLPAWMVPRHVHLRDALPLSANGKVDRTALRPDLQEAAAAAPDALAARVGVLVAEVIGQPVHPQQNLFDCGATSLHIVRLQRRLSEDLGSRLAVVDLFRLTTVAAIAGAIAGETGPDAVDSGLARAARRRQMRGRGA